MKTDLGIYEVDLKNVYSKDCERELVKAKLVPFNRRNDEHVDFVLAYADFLARVPNDKFGFADANDVARKFTELFMVHKEDDLKDVSSDFSCVLGDKRAMRTLLYNITFQKQMSDFFENA